MEYLTSISKYQNTILTILVYENVEVRLLFSTESFRNFDESIGEDADICMCAAAGVVAGPDNTLLSL